MTISYKTILNKRIAFAYLSLGFAVLAIGGTVLQYSDNPELASLPTSHDPVAPVNAESYINSELAALPSINQVPTNQVPTDQNDTGASSLLAATVSATTATQDATTPDIATTSPVTVQITVHLCDSSVRSQADLDKLGDGLSPLAAFAAKEAACPATVLALSTSTTNERLLPEPTFDFTVASTGSAPKELLSDATFKEDAVCKTTPNADLNGDVQTASTTCMDVPHYDVANVTGPNVDVSETLPPPGYAFGTVLFTPQQLKANNDASTLVYATTSVDGTGSIILNTASSTGTTITLHIFDFATSTDPLGGMTRERYQQKQWDAVDDVMQQINTLADQPADTIGATTTEQDQQQSDSVADMMQQINTLADQPADTIGATTTEQDQQQSDSVADMMRQINSLADQLSQTDSNWK